MKMEGGGEGSLTTETSSQTKNTTTIKDPWTRKDKVSSSPNEGFAWRRRREQNGSV